MRKLLIILLALFAATPLHAHIGSADVYYEGDAGPYHLFVTVRLPKIIPGAAVVEVRSAAPDVRAIQVAPLRLTGPGSDISTAPEIAEQSKDDPQFFVGSVWLAEFGSMRVRLRVDGSKGKAEMSLPVASFARQTLPFDQGLRALLAFCLITLSLGALAIIGPVVRDSTVPTGQTAPAPNRLRSRIAIAIALVLVVFSVYKGAAYCSETEADYRSKVDQLQPPRAQTTLLAGDRLLIRPQDFSVPVVGIYLDNSPASIKMQELIPDHGHLVHMFLISMPGMEKLWHLHPDLTSQNAFVQNLPPMPAGQYQMFADVTDKSGYPWTLVANVQLPEIKGRPLAGDDSGWQGDRLTLPLADTVLDRLPDGGRMVWLRGSGPIRANVPGHLKFQVEASDGAPARDMQPYMGMVAHAEIVCSDLSVFAHIHPSGTVSMAALEIAQAGQMGNAPAAMAMQMADSSRPLPSEFSFPYGFPHPGDYRIFVQIKRSGQIESAAFNAHVQ